jgi:hypothetical protein
MGERPAAPPPGHDVEFIPSSPARVATPAHGGMDDHLDDGDTIRRPMQSPPDPNFGRPLRGTQND